MTWQKALPAVALAPGNTQAVSLSGEEIRICRLNSGELFGVADCCSHDGAGFEGGTIDGNQLTCPRHGAKFDIMTGKALKMPAIAPIETFPVRIDDDGWISVDVEEE